MRVLLIILICLFYLNTMAQTNEASLSFQLSLPQGDYRKIYPKTATGLLFSLVHHSQSIPRLSIGGELGLLQISNADEIYTGFYKNAYNEYFISSTNYALTFSPKLRIQLFTLHTATIFADLSVGTNMFLTYTAISHNKQNNTLLNQLTNGRLNRDQLIIDSSASHNTWALRAGAGIGADIPIGRSNKLAILLKGSYFYGSPTHYYSHPTITDTHISLLPKQSATSMFVLETGLRFWMFRGKEKRRED